MSTALVDLAASAESLSDLLVESICYPPHREVRREAGGQFTTLDGHATTGEWDWFWNLPDRERTRLKDWFSPDGLAPDEWLSAMSYRVGDDLDSAMAEWVLATKLADAARARDPYRLLPGLVDSDTVDSMATTEYVDMPEIARMAGVKPQSIRQFRHRGQLPEPDHTYGQTPVWDRAVIEEWLAHRPRPGRPRKEVSA